MVGSITGHTKPLDIGLKPLYSTQGETNADPHRLLLPSLLGCLCVHSQPWGGWYIPFRDDCCWSVVPCLSGQVGYLSLKEQPMIYYSRLTRLWGYRINGYGSEPIYTQEQAQRLLDEKVKDYQLLKMWEERKKLEEKLPALCRDMKQEF